jgi:hypothetical protein
MLKSVSLNFYKFEVNKLVFLRLKSFVLLLSLVIGSSFAVFAQDAKPTETPKKEEKKDNKQSKNNATNVATAEQVAESAIFAYGLYVGGRPGLNQIRKTAVERGRTVLMNTDGSSETASYERRTVRGEGLEKEKIRLDQEFPSSRFSLIYNDSKIVGVFNDSVFTPREEATKAFTNQIWRGIEGLLRYKENGSTLTLNTKEKAMGVEYYPLSVTDKQNRTTRFYISAKFFRVMWLEYTEDGVKYTRKFSDYRYAQGTLVSYRNVLYADGKQIEENNTSTITYGQKLDEGLFQTS